jgi:hypothetical protein
MTYDKRHGGPYDRGSADAYYRRPFNPHYYVEGTYMSKSVDVADMSEDEIQAYAAGYDDQVESGDFKDWN